jgi:hypothetical protein
MKSSRRFFQKKNAKTAGARNELVLAQFVKAGIDRIGIGREQDGVAVGIHPAAINYAWEEAPMRMVLAIAALVSIAFGLIAVGRAWYEFRPLTDKERARLRQEGN